MTIKNSKTSGASTFSIPHFILRLALTQYGSGPPPGKNERLEEL